MSALPPVCQVTGPDDLRRVFAQPGRNGGHAMARKGACDPIPSPLSGRRHRAGNAGPAFGMVHASPACRAQCRPPENGDAG